MVDAAIRGGEGPLPGGDVDVGGLELGVFESGGAPLGFALEVDAAQWSALPLWAQRSRLEKAHLVVD
jgi:hypothetical protein